MQYTIRQSVTGAEICTFEIDVPRDATSSIKLGTAVKVAVARRLSLVGADLSYADLSGAQFDSADLRDAKLLGANLRHADFSEVDFRDANLRHADFSDANLGGAVLDGADLSFAHGIADLGQDIRGYRFFAVQNAEQGYMIGAGCRWFTPSEALVHWTAAHSSNPGVRTDCLARVEMARTIAKARGWIKAAAESRHEPEKPPDESLGRDETGPGPSR